MREDVLMLLVESGIYMLISDDFFNLLVTNINTPQHNNLLNTRISSCYEHDEDLSIYFYTLYQYGNMLSILLTVGTAATHLIQVFIETGTLDQSLVMAEGLGWSSDAQSYAVWR